MAHAPAPLFRDPIHDGAADPTLIWNRDEQAWWLLYTNRRANIDTRGVSWVHATDIGIAASTDGGQTWRYRGILPGLEFERGRNTFWAPEVLWHAGAYHMYVSYVPGASHDWSGARHIVHMTSPNLWDWRFESKLQLSSDRVIDAGIIRMPAGQWRMWYKDEAHHAHVYAADSDDLHTWRVVGPVLTNKAQEGPNVFFWRGSYWMITDRWQGQDVYRSDDCERWTYASTILRDPGIRPEDGWYGHHADVHVQGDEAYLFYFVHPQRHTPIVGTVPEVEPYTHRRTTLQVARLDLRDGVPVCDRDAPFDFSLIAP